MAANSVEIAAVRFPKYIEIVNIGKRHKSNRSEIRAEACHNTLRQHSASIQIAEVARIAVSDQHIRKARPLDPGGIPLAGGQKRQKRGPIQALQINEISDNALRTVKRRLCQSVEIRSAAMVSQGHLHGLIGREQVAQKQRVARSAHLSHYKRSDNTRPLGGSMQFRGPPAHSLHEIAHQFVVFGLSF